MSENPLIATAVDTADGPGIGIILISLVMHSLIKIAPGSEMLGIPASETNEIIDPNFNN